MNTVPRFSEFLLRPDERPLFRCLAREHFDMEIAALRDKRDPHMAKDDEDDWSAAAMRACGIAACYIVMKREIEATAFPSRRARTQPKARARSYQRG